jgi:hypothetical protein
MSRLEREPRTLPHRLSGLEDDEIRNRTNSELAGKLRIFTSVELEDLEGGPAFQGDLVVVEIRSRKRELENPGIVLATVTLATGSNPLSKARA